MFQLKSSISLVDHGKPNLIKFYWFIFCLLKEKKLRKNVCSCGTQVIGGSYSCSQQSIVDLNFTHRDANLSLHWSTSFLQRNPAQRTTYYESPYQKSPRKRFEAINAQYTNHQRSSGSPDRSAMFFFSFCPADLWGAKLIPKIHEPTRT